MTDQLLIEKILTGQKELFRILVEQNNEILYRTGMAYLNNHTEVEDLMQVTYLKAFQKLYQFQHNASFTTWLIRIMINECLMYKRKISRKMTVSLSEGDHQSQLERVSEQSSAEAQLEYEELKEISEKMLFNLPEEYRLIFILREVQKFSTAEVAEVLNLTEENVRVRLFRAKKMLQKLIIEQFGDPEFFAYHKKYCNVLTEKVMAQIKKVN